MVKVNILDCTLRDGGYYNSWRFSSSIVNAYINALTESSVTHIELGFRFAKQDNNLGKFAFTTEEHLNSIDFPGNQQLGVMINGDEYLNSEDPCNLITKYFLPAKRSKISFVRIAIDLVNAPKAKILIDCLDDLGYEVMLNLMQANQQKSDVVEATIAIISKWKNLKVLYFADSLGSMNAVAIKKFIKKLKLSWKGKIGFHAHNNMSLALSNATTAIKLGCQFCDSTLMGMGRGAGNAQTEYLLPQVQGKYNPTSMLFVLAKFQALKNKFQWGPNMFYYFAAEHSIHPTYIQRMLFEKRYSDNQILETITSLRAISSTSFNESKMSQLTYFSSSSHQGSWNAKGFLKGKSILLLGSGPNLKKFKHEIIQFIEKNNPYVISLNVNQLIPKKYINSIIASNIDRVLIDVDLYGEYSCPIIMPQSCFSPLIKSKLQLNNILDYGMAINANSFKSSQKGCISEWKEVIAYALLFLEQASPELIYLAGFDGYSKTDLRQSINNKIFSTYFAKTKASTPILLTPSTFPALSS